MEQTVIVDGKIVSFLYNPWESNSFFLFLHGRGRRKEDWNRYIDKLKEKKIWFLALDLPWFWKSQHPWEVWGIEEYSQFVIHCLDKLEITKPVSLVCHSFWGRIAFYLASHDAERIKQLYLAAPWWVEKPISPLRQKMYHYAKKIFSIPWLSSLKKRLIKYIGSSDYITNPAMREILSKVVNQDLRKYFPKISQKTFLYRWEKDDQILFWQINEIKEGIKNLHLKIFPLVSHDVHIEKSDEILRDMLKE